MRKLMFIARPSQCTFLLLSSRKPFSQNLINAVSGNQPRKGTVVDLLNTWEVLFNTAQVCLNTSYSIIRLIRIVI
jgi:hypothetical protein